MRGGEVVLTSLLLLGTLMAVLVLVPVALAVGGWAGFMVAAGLWH